jgi:hypothetical protein
MVNVIPVAKKTTPHVKISMLTQPMINCLHHKVILSFSERGRVASVVCVPLNSQQKKPAEAGS